MRRLRPRSSRVLFVAAILLGVSVTTTLQGHLARLEARAATGGDGTPAVVAASAMPRGTALGPGSVRVVVVPELARPPGALSSVEQALGRSLAADVAAGEVLTELRIRRGGPVAALVPPGLRAVPVPAAVPPGAIVPGDRVDVLSTALDGAPFSETVAREVEVLRIDAGAAEGATTVFVLVAPETAERLAAAASFSQLSLAVVAAR